MGLTEEAHGRVPHGHLGAVQVQHGVLQVLLRISAPLLKLQRAWWGWHPQSGSPTPLLQGSKGGPEGLRGGVLTRQSAIIQTSAAQAKRCSCCQPRSLAAWIRAF